MITSDTINKQKMYALILSLIGVAVCVTPVYVFFSDERTSHGFVNARTLNLLIELLVVTAGIVCFRKWSLYLSLIGIVLALSEYVRWFLYSRELLHNPDVGTIVQTNRKLFLYDASWSHIVILLVTVILLLLVLRLIIYLPDRKAQVDEAV
jgi:hypothetical protein